MKELININLSEERRLVISINEYGNLLIQKQYKHSFYEKPWATTAQIVFEPEEFKLIFNAIEKVKKLLLLA